MRSRWAMIWGGTLLLIGVILFAQQAGLFGPLRLSLIVLLLGFPAFMFILTFVLDRRKWWTLIPGATLLFLTAIAFNGLSPYATSVVSGAIVLLTIGLCFWSLFTVKRRLWWALIASIVVPAIAIVAIVGASRVPGRVVGEILFALFGPIKISFLVFLFGIPGLMLLLVYVLDRRQWWALIPSSILNGLAAITLNELNRFSSGWVSFAIFLFSIALPLWLIYFIQHEWWLILPAGIMTMIASIPIMIDSTIDGAVICALFFLGLSVVFLLTRLLHLARSDLRWTWWPASVLGGVGVFILLLSNNVVAPYILPGLLIIVGGGLLLRNFLQPKGS